MLAGNKYRPETDCTARPKDAKSSLSDFFTSTDADMGKLLGQVWRRQKEEAPGARQAPGANGGKAGREGLGDGQPRERRSSTRRRVSTKTSAGSRTAAAGVAKAGAAASTAGRSKAENTSDSSSVRTKESAPSGGNRKGRGVGAASAEVGHEDVKKVKIQGATTAANAQKRTPVSS